MRFSGDAYNKVYPHEIKETESVESAVESFKPTEEFSNAEIETEEVVDNGNARDNQSIVE